MGTTADMGIAVDDAGLGGEEPETVDKSVDLDGGGPWIGLRQRGRAGGYGWLADLLRGVARIGQEYSVLVTCAGHAGDGNMHPAVVFDPADEDMTARALEAFGAIMRLGLDLGGTITGEHGVGLLKRSWLEAELGEVALAAHRSIKQALDPLNILNPGKVLSMGESLSRK